MSVIVLEEDDTVSGVGLISLAAIFSSRFVSILSMGGRSLCHRANACALRASGRGCARTCGRRAAVHSCDRTCWLMGELVAFNVGVAEPLRQRRMLREAPERNMVTVVALVTLGNGGRDWYRCT